MRYLKCEVNRTLRPIRNAQSPTLGEVLSDGAYQRVLQRFTHRVRDGIDTPLLGNLIGMIKVEFVCEFVKRDVKSGRRLSAPLRDISERLRS